MKRVLTILALVAALLVVGGVAWGSIPGSDGVIHGCYKTSNPATGSVIVVDETASCPSGFAPLNWNQTGPAGVSGLQYVEVTQVIPAGGFDIGMNAFCPSGKYATGGGFLGDTYTATDGSQQAFVALRSQPPISLGKPIGWHVELWRTGPPPSQPVTVKAYAICVNAT